MSLLKLHYRSNCCTHSTEKIQLSKDDTSLSGLIEKYIRKLFDERKVSAADSKALFKYYYNKLSKGVDLGYNPKTIVDDSKLAESLKNNIAQFSAFKQSSFKKQLENILIENGTLLPWSDFKKKAQALHIDYNQRWLETEYHQTVATANMAGKWQDFQADADVYPNLKYVTVNDARVRDQHKAWNGLTLPITHAFWKAHWPPQDWGCRCDVEQTDEPVTKEIPSLQIKDGFKNNAGITGEIFPSKSNPYVDGLSKSEILEAEKVAKTETDFDILNKNEDFRNNLKIIKDNNFDKIYPNIDPEKINSVYTYTSNSYQEINKFNRTGNFIEDLKKGRTKKYYETLTKTINTTLDEIPDKFKGLTYRGTDLDATTFKRYTDALKNGKPISDKGFTSTSYDIKEGFGGTHKFKIVSKNGTIVDKVSANGVDAAKLDGINEKEVLFKAGQEFKVSYILETEPGKYEIFMEQL